MKSVRAVFTDTYHAQRQKMDAKDVAKLEQAIEAHGYRGASKAKHNGVVNIKPLPQDAQLWKALERHKVPNQHESKKDLEFVIDVKVVAHCPSGNRIVGSLYRDRATQELVLILHAFANYNRRLF